MSSKSREVIWGGRIMGADVHAKAAREIAQKAIRKADRAEADAWSVRMVGYGGPAQPSPTIAQCQWQTVLARGRMQSLQDESWSPRAAMPSQVFVFRPVLLPCPRMAYWPIPATDQRHLSWEWF
jgi:hypothetical protein